MKIGYTTVDFDDACTGVLKIPFLILSHGSRSSTAVKGLCEIAAKSMTWALQKGTFLNYSSKNMENCWIYSWCIVGIFLEYHWYGISFVSYWYIGWASINTCPVSLPTSLEL